MAKKRILPLFMFDLDRSHGLGECDFIYCSDKENGFIARVDILSYDEYSTLETNNIDSKLIINDFAKVGAHIKIVRHTGTNPSDTQIRALMKKASELYQSKTQKKVDANNFGVDDYIKYLDIRLRYAQQSLAEIGSDYNERKIVQFSISIIDSLINHLRNE